MKKPITTFTLENLNELRKSMESALKPIEEQYGITFDLGRMTYGEIDMKMSIACSVGSGSEALRLKFETDIKRGYGRIFDLAVEDFGQKMLHTGKEYTLVGLNTRARTKPLKMVDAEGREYSVPVEMYKRFKINKDGSIGTSK